MRKDKVLIDGAEVARLREGEEIATDVSPGRHLVTAKVDNWDSNVVEVLSSLDGELSLKLSPNGETTRELLRNTRRDGYQLRLERLTDQEGD